MRTTLPVQPEIVLASAKYRVEDHAKPVPGEEDGATVHRRARRPLIRAMFASHHTHRAGGIEAPKLRGSEIHHAEPPTLHHLVAAVNGQRVVARGAVEVTVHGLVRIRVAAAVDGDLVSSPEEVDMEHVGLHESLSRVAAAE